MCVVQVEGYTSDTDKSAVATQTNVCADSSNTKVEFTFFVNNIDDIGRAFGGDCARQVVDAVCSIVARLAEGRATAVSAADGKIHLGFPQRASAERLSPADAGEDWVRLVCRSIPHFPIWTEQGVLHVRVSGRVAGRWSIDGASDDAARFFGASGAPIAESDEGAARYRADMAAASKLLCQLAGAEGSGHESGALRTVWRPVVAHQNGDVLYYQSVAEADAGAGDPRLARAGLAAVERIGFDDILDEIAVNAVLAELEADPCVVLSASISSVGILNSWWWKRLAARLEREPDLAARLVLEIAEGSALVKHAELVGVCDEARRLGCPIAIADFGSGFASIRHLVTIAPDIVKIDCGFLRRSTTSPRDRAILQGLVQIAAAVGAIVVADGIETFDQAELASGIGLDWQQGHFWGAASTCRPWRGARVQPARGGEPRAFVAALPG